MTRKRASTPHLFAQWERIARRIRENKQLVVFLDFDGTLVHIAPMPDGVCLEEDTRQALKKLAARPNVTLAVISGRQRAELEHFIGIRKLNYLGLYGWERKGNEKTPYSARLALVRALQSLLAELPAYPGVWIEPKRNSFSVHLKGASPETQQQVRQAVGESVKPLRKTLQVMANLRDLEVAPVAIGDKGVAVRKFLGKTAMRGVLPIYFGDDFSDEPAFAALREGIPILVGKRRATQARFSLRGPAEVAAALFRIEETIR